MSDKYICNVAKSNDVPKANKKTLTIKTNNHNKCAENDICKIKAIEGKEFYSDFLFHSLEKDLQKINTATGATTVMDWGNIGGSAGLMHLGNNIIANSYLPVELTQFEAIPKNEMVELSWQTATEKNNEGFEIERSSNGKDWETLDFVQGNGTTLKTQNYTYIDEQPIENNYYRLKQIDFDGQFEYSDISHVNYKLGIKNYVNVFPNPATDELNIIDGQGQATIHNLLGQTVRQFSINNEQFSINVTDLPKGQYILHIKQQNGIMTTKRFIK